MKPFITEAMEREKAMNDERQEVNVFQKAWQDEIDRRDEIINSDKQIILDLRAENDRLAKLISASPPKRKKPPAS